MQALVNHLLLKTTEGTIEEVIRMTTDQMKEDFWDTERTIDIAHMMSPKFVMWLIEQDSEGKLKSWQGILNQEKEEVQAFFCEKSREGTTIFSLLNLDDQMKAAFWNTERTNDVAHMMSPKFVMWLVQQASKGKWSKEEISDIVWRKNKDNHLVFKTLDQETQNLSLSFVLPSDTGLFTDESLAE